MSSRRRVAIVGCRPPLQPEWPTAKQYDAHIKMSALYGAILVDVCQFVRQLSGVVVVSGGAIGVDTAAEATACGFLETIIHRPDYAKYGPKRAPLERNTLIVRDSDEIHAWPAPWSRGTWDTIRKARAAGKPVTVHEVKP